MMKRVGRVLVAGGLAVVVPGCTWIEPEGPPPVVPREEFVRLTQGDLGSAHAYVVGIAPERLAQGDRGREQALLSSLTAETKPAVPAAAPVATAAVPVVTTPGANSDAEAKGADLNFDGFLTLDELVALHRSGVGEAEMVRQVKATGYVLGATRSQLVHLREFGVPGGVLELLQQPGRNDSSGRNDSRPLSVREP